MTIIQPLVNTQVFFLSYSVVRGIQHKNRSCVAKSNTAPISLLRFFYLRLPRPASPLSRAGFFQLFLLLSSEGGAFSS